MMKIDTSEWKPFAIGNIFDVVKGTRLTKANMTSGDIRFLLRTTLTCYIRNSK